MLKFYNKLKHTLAMLSIFLLCIVGQAAHAQCTITSATAEGCFGTITGFTASSGLTFDRVEWVSPAGTTQGTSVNLLLPIGTNKVDAVFYSNNTPVCTATVNFIVHALPVSDFIRDKYSQCYAGNVFCFQDLSTAAQGNNIVQRVILFGDFTADSSVGGGTMCHTYALQIGGYFDVEQRVIDNKGCVGEVKKVDYVHVIPDLGVNFNHNTPTGCMTTTVPFNNTSLVQFDSLKRFYWDWGDGERYESDDSITATSLVDRCYWDNPVHTYTKHGCFDVTLYAVNDSGCADTLIIENYACNINPDMDLFETAGKDGQCHSTNDFTFSHNLTNVNNWPLSFLWDFGDPDSGPANFNFSDFTDAKHVFSKPDLFTITFSGTMAGCAFAGETNVLVKGPGATIENKMIPDIIADTQRHQCEIKDTVYFTNNSSFMLNDSFVLDDTTKLLFAAGTKIYKGDIAYLCEIPTDGTDLTLVEDVIDNYRWDGIDYLVLAHPLQSMSENDPLIKDKLIKYNNFFGAVWGARDDNHVRTVWDFADDAAPNCTTWTKYQQNIWDYSKPVYRWYDANHIDPLSGRMGYSKFYRGDAERATEPDQSKFIDTTYEWMNCRYSRDILPKHWYTPGKEACFVVRLTLEDTTFQNASQEIHYTTPKKLKDLNGGSFPELGGVFKHDFVRFGPDPDIKDVFDYPPLFDANGDTVFITNPNCTSEKLGYERDYTKPQFKTGTITVPTRTWINPDVQSGDACKSEGTVLLALMPPNADGMVYDAPNGVCFGPAPPYGIYFDWSQTKPGCTQQFVWLNYDSAFDRRTSTPLNMWVPQSAFMLNPTTPWPMATLNMPQWPTTAFKNYFPYDTAAVPAQGTIGDSCGFITVGLRIMNGKNPATNQPCIDEKWYHKMLRYIPVNPVFTMDKGAGCNPLEVKVSLVNDLQDSLLAMVYRFSPVMESDDPNDTYIEVDSVHRRKYDPITGDTINYIITWKVDYYGIATKIDSNTFIPGVGGISACGSELRLQKHRTFTLLNQNLYAVLVQAFTTDRCQGFHGDRVVIGFAKEAEADKTLICQDETVSFTNMALYYKKYEDQFGPYVLYPYWVKPNEDFNPDGSIRLWPEAKRESVRWDFRQDDLGWVFMPASPQVSFRLPGHYDVMVEFKDSNGCADTITMPIDVTGTKANFGFNVRAEACKPIVDFFDSSEVYDPCYIRNGVKCDSIVTYWWTFGDGSGFTTTYTVNGPPITKPSYKYNSFGDYDVTLVVETALGCRDTIRRSIIIEGPRPQFEFTIDSVGCVPFTVYLTNTSIDPLASAEFLWRFVDITGNYSEKTVYEDTSIVFHTFDIAGTYHIELYQKEYVGIAGTDCQDTFPKLIKKEVRVLPERKVDFVSNKIYVCPNEPVTFNDRSDGIYTKYKWIYGDGDTTVGDKADTQVVHSYKSTGVYTVRLLPEYTPAPGDPKCGGSKTMQIYVNDVFASFTVDSTQKPMFKFTNTSTNGVNYWWNFDEGNGYEPCPGVDPVNCPNAHHDYGNNVDSFNVCLIAQSPEGCYDTVCHKVWNDFEVCFDVWNAFTPNGDGINDEFYVEVCEWLKYEIKIYNRHGDLVFESNTPDNPWNGKNFNTGAENTAGVYYVVINYQLRGKPEETYSGTANLIR